MSIFTAFVALNFFTVSAVSSRVAQAATEMAAIIFALSLTGLMLLGLLVAGLVTIIVALVSIVGLMVMRSPGPIASFAFTELLAMVSVSMSR